MRHPEPTEITTEPLSEPGLRELSVPVTALDRRGRSRRQAAIAAVLVVAALGTAIVSGQLSPVGPAARAQSTAVAAASPSGGSPLPARPTPTAVPSMPPGWPPLDQPAWSGFVDDVRNLRLDGRVVLLSGGFEVNTLPCSGGEGICPDLSFPGLDIPVHVAGELLPWDGDPPAAATLVLAIGDGALLFLGAIPPDVPSPVAITTLLESRSRSLALNDLYPVTGVLFPNPTPCEPSAPIGTQTPPPCAASPILLDAGSTLGDIPVRGAPVSLATPLLPQIGSALRVEGTFLVRRILRDTCDPAMLPVGSSCDQQRVIRPQVVALLSAATAVRVDLPANLASMGSVSGVVVDAKGQPLAGYEVRATGTDGEAPDLAIAYGTGENGAFGVPGLLPSTWRIDVIQSGPYGDIVIGRVSVQIDPGQAVRVRIVATPGTPIP